MKKKKLITVLIILVFVIVTAIIYFSTIKNSPPQHNNKPISVEKNNQANLDAIAHKMINDNEINEYLIYQCHYNETNCGDNFFYKWKKEDSIDYVAFLSNMDENNWKSDPFNYSTEIFQVNIQDGDVYRQSPFDGSFEFITNIYK